MEPNKNAFMFVGDSFTWGQGLYFYSKLNNQKHPPAGKYIDSEVTPLQKKYKDSRRFARIVANHFNTFEVVKESNGGSDINSLEFIDDFFKKYSYNDVSTIIFQTTHFGRSPFTFTYEGIEYSCNIDGYPNSIDHDRNIEKFVSWCQENNITFEKYVELHKKQIYDKIREKFVFLNDNGINMKLICWTNDYVSYLKHDDFMNGRFIKTKYNDSYYVSFFDLMFFNKELMISHDPFFNFSIGDGHLSLYAHEIVSKSIIENLENIDKNINKDNLL
jgi:hypothetical protein